MCGTMLLYLPTKLREQNKVEDFTIILQKRLWALPPHAAPWIALPKWIAPPSKCCSDAIRYKRIHHTEQKVRTFMIDPNLLALKSDKQFRCIPGGEQGGR